VNIFINVLMAIVQAVISIELFLMLIRAILSWVMPDSEGGIIDFLYYLTEPIISPVRNLLYKIPALQELPIDLSFTVTYMILALILMFI